MRKLDWDILDSSIIDKILSGDSSWTDAELQYHRNFPDDIESALAIMRSAESECIYHNGILLVPSYYKLSLRNLLAKHYVQRGKPVRRVITSTNAVALSLFSGTKYEGTGAIVIVGKNAIEFLIMRMVDGVHEVWYLDWDPSVNEPENGIFRLCHSFIGECFKEGYSSSIDELIVFSDKPVDERVISQFMHQQPTVISNPAMFCQKGMDIQAGILDGMVKDVLLLDMTPYSFTVEAEDGSVLGTMERCLFPSRKNFEFEVPESGIIAVKEGIGKDKLTIGRMILPVDRRTRKISFVFDVDANGKYKMELMS